MKRVLITALAVVMMLSLFGCAKNGSSETKAAPAAPATDALYLDTQLSEPEWTLAEGELSLKAGDTTCAEGEDILYFAIVTDTNGTQELRFKLSDTAAASLKVQSPDTAYYMTLDGNKIGDATLNADCTEAVITADHAVGEITALASRIRGLAQ